jgi:hypothetical protein
VSTFLGDLREALGAACALVRPGGAVALVVGRRVLAGLRVPLDAIVAEWCDDMHVDLSAVMRRQIPYKRIPRWVARSGSAGEGQTLTTLEEYVLIGHRRR